MNSSYITPNDRVVQTGLTDPPKVPQIQGELDELGFAIDALEKSIDSLAVRYAPIMIQAGPQLEQADPRKDSRSLVVVAENIRQKSSKIKSLIARVQSLEQRAEI